MNTYPIKLLYHVRIYSFGERSILDMLGEKEASDGGVAETREVSDYPDARAPVTNGGYAGRRRRPSATRSRRRVSRRARRREMERATLLPAGIGEVNVLPLDAPEYSDLIACYAPDLERDVILPLREAGYPDEQVCSLGEVGI